MWIAKTETSLRKENINPYFANQISKPVQKWKILS
jgi:hypothetical protein